jgi:hypothetical protein
MSAILSDVSSLFFLTYPSSLVVGQYTPRATKRRKAWEIAGSRKRIIESGRKKRTVTFRVVVGFVEIAEWGEEGG